MRLWLKNIRKDNRQETVAEMAGITQQMYNAIELGERRPSVDVAKGIAAVLGFKWTQFFERRGTVAPLIAPSRIDRSFFD